MSSKDLIFYDGTCGLCHAFVKFVLARDHRDSEDARFLFAPLQGETIAHHLPAEKRQTLPDSVVMLTTNGEILLKSDAALYVLRHLPGWRPVAWLLSLVPRPLRDLGYAAIARLRRQFFRPPPGMCPLVPQNLKERFLP